MKLTKSSIEELDNIAFWADKGEPMAHGKETDEALRSAIGVLASAILALDIAINTSNTGSKANKTK